MVLMNLKSTLTDMEHLLPDAFYAYMKRPGEKFLYNPRVSLAFRSYEENGGIQVFCKSSGNNEVRLSYDDEDYNEAWLFKIVMTEDEYREF